MNALDFKLEFKIDNEKSVSGIPVVIVAAGASLRMQGINKQLITLCGVPAIIHTLMAFEKSEYISEIVLVTREDSVNTMRELANKYMITKLTDIALGGKCRGESVLNGLNCIKNKNCVMIHDGARPLVTEKIIKSVFKGLKNFDCVIPVVPVKDTIKEIFDDKTVNKTLNRENLVAVQTPQGVNLGKYIDIVNAADLSVFTDDASVMESKDFKVLTVDGDYENIKITTPEDIVIAEYYLEKRGDAE